MVVGQRNFGLAVWAQAWTVKKLALLANKLCACFVPHSCPLPACLAGTEVLRLARTKHAIASLESQADADLVTRDTDGGASGHIKLQSLPDFAD